MRSGQLKATNDELVRAFLQDPRYDVRPDGTIWSLRQGSWELSGRRDRDGYIEIYYKGKRLKAHRIVYAKFGGRLADDLVIDHVNAERDNNHPSNLALCAQRRNEIQKHIRRRKAA